MEARAGDEVTLGLWVRAREPLSGVGLTLSFDPTQLAVLRVEEGGLVRRFAGRVAFAPRVDTAAGRIDINLSSRDEAGITGEGDLVRVAVALRGTGGTSSISLVGAAARTLDGRARRLPEPAPHPIRLRP